ncbi:hypothetical protein PM082_024523 [Marasmius tenuissimus]|nr:hypothetical protein PM082_024523 [Marasmius tenuissimus]
MVWSVRFVDEHLALSSSSHCSSLAPHHRALPTAHTTFVSPARLSLSVQNIAAQVQNATPRRLDGIGSDRHSARHRVGRVQKVYVPYRTAERQRTPTQAELYTTGVIFSRSTL